MANTLVPIDQAKAPAAMRARLNAGTASNKNFAGGVRDSFPILSIKGKVFRIRANGQETPLIDPVSKQTIPALDVVLVNGSPTLSKAYYIKQFSDETEFSQPDCWSLDSVKPDASVPNKVNPTCPDCPMNVFGSAPSRDGTKRGGKACQDARRIAVMMPSHIETNEPLVFMLRVPPTSLKNLKAYAQLLERQGWEPNGCVTRLQFDYNEAYPKLTFSFVDGLTDGEYDKVVVIADSKQTHDMLMAPDFDMVVSPAQAKVPPAPEPQRIRQAAPVMANPEVVLTAVAPVQVEPAPVVQAAPPSGLVELPTGELFDPSTGEFIQRAAPAVEMPSLDPDTLDLRDGRFFNRKTKTFVIGPEVGARPVTEEEPKRRAPRKAKAPEVKQEAAAIPEEAPVEKQAANGNGEDDEPKVQPTSAAMDDMIRSVFPTKN